MKEIETYVRNASGVPVQIIFGVGVSSTFQASVLAFADPELTLTSPPTVTSFSGADTLCNTLESYLSPKRELTVQLLAKTFFVVRNPNFEGYTTRAVGLIGNNRLRSVQLGSGLESRNSLAKGAM